MRLDGICKLLETRNFKKQINSIKKSKNKIERYVAIPISIKVSTQTYSKVAKKIISLLLSKKGARFINEKIYFRSQFHRL